ncbi:homoserine O-acetyltransferase [soil metagenome]
MTNPSSNAIGNSVGIIQKKEFRLPAFTTLGGKTIREVKIGYETYGKLNAQRDNAILVAHFFSGTSQAAGKYAEGDALAGYWDAIIGPGKAIDTDKFFVISSDTLVNLASKDPHTITTGPASIDPDTGKQYGMRFPIVAIRDFVNVQKALVDSLGIEKLYAVAGPSMGSMQALEWAAAFPDMVPRVIAAIPAGIESDAFLVGMLNLVSAPVMLDPKWNKGDYYGKEEPLEGLALGLKIVTVAGRHYGWAGKTFGRKPSSTGVDPQQGFQHPFAFEEALDMVSLDRTRFVDPNSLLYMVKACQLYSLGHQGSAVDGVKKVKAKVMLIPAQSDILMFPAYSRKAEAIFTEAGNPPVYFELQGDGGHFDGLLAISQAGAAIRSFLET